MNMTQNMKNQLIDNINSYASECYSYINRLINEREVYLKNKI